MKTSDRYCRKCGAYIPTGESECMSCGAKTEEPKKTSEHKKKTASDYKYDEKGEIDLTPLLYTNANVRFGDVVLRCAFVEDGMTKYGVWKDGQVCQVRMVITGMVKNDIKQ